MSEDNTSPTGNQLQVLLIVNIITLILQTITTVITSMRCKGKCPCCDFRMRPSNTLPTPPDAVDPENPQTITEATRSSAVPAIHQRLISGPGPIEILTQSST